MYSGQNLNLRSPLTLWPKNIVGGKSCAASTHVFVESLIYTEKQLGKNVYIISITTCMNDQKDHLCGWGEGSNRWERSDDKLFPDLLILHCKSLPST